MLKIGVTGGIGSGKSTVCSIFSSLGIPIYNSDHRAKMLMVDNAKVVSSIKEVFGENAYQDGALNRKHISSIAFYEPSKLESLNAIVHPAVFEDFRNWVSEQKNTPYIIKEAALMFESGSYKDLDKVIDVNAPEELRIMRVQQRDYLGADEIKKRIASQLSDEERTKRADYIINNDELELLVPQVLKLHHIFISMVK